MGPRGGGFRVGAFWILGAPARHITHARKRILKIPPGWAWATDVVAAWDRLPALHPA